jgi:dGTPase
LFDLLVTGLIEGTIAAASASGAANVVEVRHYPQRIAQFSSHAQEITRQIKHFLYEHLYCSAELGQDRQDSMARLSRLFGQLIARGEDCRSVCDFIAGMTDRYFLRYYESLNPA